MKPKPTQKQDLFYYLNHIQLGKIPENTEGFKYLKYIANRFISMRYLKTADVTNQYTFTLPPEQYLKLLTILTPNGGGFIRYIKKSKEEQNLPEEVRQKIKKFYGWSEREYKLNEPVLLCDKERLRRLIAKLGVGLSVIKKMFNIKFKKPEKFEAKQEPLHNFW